MNPPSYPVWDGAILVGQTFDVIFNNDGGVDNLPTVGYDSQILALVLPVSQVNPSQFKTTFKAVAPSSGFTIVTGTWTTKDGTAGFEDGVGIPVRQNPWATGGSISVMPGNTGWTIGDTFTVTIEVNGEVDPNGVAFGTDEPNQPSKLLSFGPVQNPSPNVYTSVVTVKGSPGQCSITGGATFQNGLYSLFFRTQILYFSNTWADANSTLSVANLRF